VGQSEPWLFVGMRHARGGWCGAQLAEAFDG
jgi:hypothetical protein